ncbi:MAG TPA: amino acid permease [Bryobacterales bacterium]|nr:amino acid permease [Bryobacterales bacterium]
MANLLIRKPLQQLMEEAGDQGAHTLKRCLGPWQLLALGIGAVIGAGIFVLTGEAAYENAGPAVILSFIASGIACAFAGLCYAEFASMIPIAGSAYTYSYATLGELFAWIIGWDLMLEYALGASTVSVGWTGYFVTLLKHVGIEVPAGMSTSTFVLDAQGHFQNTGAFNVVSFLVLLLISVILAVGIQESATVNTTIVFLKVAIVLLFIIGGVWYIKPANWEPFIPPNTGVFGHYGWSGILRGGALVFFAYIGFDAVSTAAQETRNPARDLPIGILGSLAICTLLYILVSGILTGIVSYKLLGVPHPVAVGIEATPLKALSWIVELGAVLGLGSVMLVMLLGQSRVFYTMSKDGLLPEVFARIHPTFRTPYVVTMLTGVVVAIIAGLLPIGVLAQMVNIGTLLAFVIVSASVIVLRRRRPDLPRPFKTPGYPVVPALGVVTSLALMAFLPADTWWRLIVWLIIGLLIYGLYGRRHSKVRVAARRPQSAPAAVAGD